MGKELNNKILNATKWSAITEIASKLITPVSTMVLARLLTPDAFGILVTATMVISFAEIFTDAGFQKYIIQHAFKDDDDLYNSTAVAFWSNLIFSLIVWGVICIFSDQIAHLVGNDGYGLVISTSCICIPLASFSSIQMALFKRKLDFKTLFVVRIFGILIPIIVTIPLAYFTRSFWALIIGMIALNLCNAIVLTWKSSWKPTLYYNVSLFKEMFSFTMWSMIEAISIWLTNYIDVFIVGTILTNYYMGLYRTSITTVGHIMALITSATTPVLFSSLSRLQNNTKEFNDLFLKFQNIVGLLIIPLGVGIFLFKKLITEILLGDQWYEASFFIGLWGITSAITIVMSHYCSEVFRAKGKPKLSVLSQSLHLLFVIPTVLLTVNYGFDTLCLSRSLVRFTAIAINLYLLYNLTGITPADIIMNLSHILFSALVMIFVYLLLPKPATTLLSFLYIIICSLIYVFIMLLFKRERYMFHELIYLIKRK